MARTNRELASDLRRKSRNILDSVRYGSRNQKLAEFFVDLAEATARMLTNRNKAKFTTERKPGMTSRKTREV